MITADEINSFLLDENNMEGIILDKWRLNRSMKVHLREANVCLCSKQEHVSLQHYYGRKNKICFFSSRQV